MALRFLKSLLVTVMLFHCLGVTQLASAYSKDRSAFVGMVNMNEEETKKEKESKEDADYFNISSHKISSLAATISFTNKYVYFCCAKSRVNHQFIIELPTPPPDSLV